MKNKLHPMYQKMLDNGLTMQDVIDAGYFEDGLTYDGKPKPKTKSIILGMSGCFAPLHDGHINALVLAKEYFEKVEGYTDISAVLFPAHDSYVQTKHKNEKYTIEFRYRQIWEKIFDKFPWIMADVSLAYDYENDVNFPVIIDKLQKMAKVDSVFHMTADTAFVFGGDNAKFAYAFSESPTKAVCIQRDKPIDIDRSKLINVDYHEIVDNSYGHYSSTKIRKGEL